MDSKKKLTTILGAVVGLVVLGAIVLMTVLYVGNARKKVAPTAGDKTKAATPTWVGNDQTCTATFTVTAPATCNQACGSSNSSTGNTSCGDGLKCINGMCRNEACSAETDCVCAVPDKAACAAKVAYKDSSSNKAGQYVTTDELKVGTEKIKTGDKIVFQLKGKADLVENAAGDIVWADTLDPKLEYVDGPACISFNASTRTIICNLGKLTKGQSYTIAFRVKVKSDTTAAEIGNSAQVTTGGTDASSCTATLAIATPTLAACNAVCGNGISCSGGLSCDNGRCRNTQCTGETDCICPTSTPTSTPTATPTTTPTLASCNNSCSVNSDCKSEYVCSGGVCRNPSCTYEAGCVCPGGTYTPATASCNESCSVNGDCASNYICSGGTCRNPSCVGESDCTCTTTTYTQPTSTPTPVELPDAGISLPTLAALGGGLVMVLIGILLAL